MPRGEDVVRTHELALALELALEVAISRSSSFALSSCSLSSREKAESYQMKRPASAVPSSAIRARLYRPPRSGPSSRSTSASHPRITCTDVGYMAALSAVKAARVSSLGHVFFPKKVSTARLPTSSLMLCKKLDWSGCTSSVGVPFHPG